MGLPMSKLNATSCSQKVVANTEQLVTVFLVFLLVATRRAEVKELRQNLEEQVVPNAQLKVSGW